MLDHANTSVVRPIYLMIKFSIAKYPCRRRLGKLGRSENIHNS